MRSSLIVLAFATAAVVSRPIEDGHSSLAIRGVESSYVVRAYDAEDGKIHDAIHGAIHKVAAFGKKLLGSKPKAATAPAPAPAPAAEADASATADAAAPADPAVAARDVDTEDGHIADAVHKVHSTIHNAVTSAIAFGKKLLGGKSKATAAPPTEASPETPAADTAAPADPAA